MVEIRIHGRGGQGGVTLAKLLAASRFLQGRSVQAFGLYAAERSGAPVQAFCRWDDAPIVDRNLVYEPDHVVVLDPTLVGPGLTAGLRPEGWVVLNAPGAPASVRAAFPGHPVATVDAAGIARRHGLGTRSVPIVNTAMAGAVGRVLGMPLEEVLAALEHLGLGDGNVAAAREAFAAVRTATALPPETPTRAPTRPEGAASRASFVQGAGGAAPTVRTGLWATEQPLRQQHVPPCDHVCPAGNDVRGFLEALARDDVDGALEILLRTSPFPATCGRVCPAPCMAACNRAALDGAVNVRAMERLAGDRGRAGPTPRARRPERVAVVGSGPAGLTAAWHLALLGYGVTVYEAGPEPGGLLRTGIPAFRLPAAVLDREVERIQALGVEMVTGVRVDRPRLRALARNHDAVLVASGLQVPRSLELGEAGGGVVLEGIELLAAVRSGEAVPELHGEDVVVVGGGNTAVDAARSALRLGAASVRIVYRRSRAEMPAIREEVEEALEEGVILDLLTRPVALERMAQADGDGGCWHLRCRRTELGPPGPDGRRRPVDVPGSDSALPCHRVVLALGQSPDPSLFPEDADVAEGLELLGIPRRPVWAVGDVATGAGTVAAAIGSGRLAALRVHRCLSGETPEEEHAARRRPDADRWRDEVVRADALRLDRFEPAPARADPVLDPDRRRGGFREVHGTLDDTAEARRCLSCGVCNRCGLCVACCPEGVLQWDGDALVVDGEYCKGCGICAVECPRHVIFMSHL